jgi:EamA domain-containing membrane protein RarD
MGRTACTEPQYLYSRAIPLLPLCAVRPVQSLSACTVELYLYSPYGPYGLYRASVPVQSLSACTVELYLYSPYGLYRTSVPVQGRTLPLINKYINEHTPTLCILAEETIVKIH